MGSIFDLNSNDARVQGVQKFFNNIAGDRRLTATAVQTVGSKGVRRLCFGTCGRDVDWSYKPRKVPISRVAGRRMARNSYPVQHTRIIRCGLRPAGAAHAPSCDIPISSSVH